MNLTRRPRLCNSRDTEPKCYQPSRCSSSGCHSAQDAYSRSRLELAKSGWGRGTCGGCYPVASGLGSL